MPEDVVLTSVRSLPAALRRELECEDGDYAVTRPHSRTPSRVVDASTADLLRQFAQAKPIVEAIIAFSRASGNDPEETLSEAFPALQRLVNDGLLVLAGSNASKAIKPSFSPGERLAGFVVVDIVQVLEDSEVYRAEAGDGAVVAVKVARPEAAGLRRALAREEAILRRLDGTATPVSEMLSAAAPTLLTSLRSVSIPVSKSNSKMPNCEMPSSMAFCSGVLGKSACCRSGSSTPSAEGPSRIPPSNIPMTEG